MSQTRTTVTLDDDLMKRARSITKLESVNSVVNVALEQLVRTDARRKLASLMGTETEKTQAAPRRADTSDKSSAEEAAPAKGAK